ncbi:MAG: 2,3,4,5-tetrahydropyridine-2,6-dicarboxylate N-succinyltransferase, partial [Gaiellaceae bacterium]|nr:2,3,4,5-tetrahydropyridine-2,6-dicarboxylate N-succinyltransferase [Gaiellaceae bacterium]
MEPGRVEEVVAALDRGETRVAERVDGEWRVNEEAQEAILGYFRLRQMEPMEVGPFEYHDKIPLKRDYEQLGVRVVPPAVARYGAFLSPGVVLMPSYV